MSRDAFYLHASVASLGAEEIWLLLLFAVIIICLPSVGMISREFKNQRNIQKLVWSSVRAVNDSQTIVQQDGVALKLCTSAEQRWNRKLVFLASLRPQQSSYQPETLIIILIIIMRRRRRRRRRSMTSVIVYPAFFKQRLYSGYAGLSNASKAQSVSVIVEAGLWQAGRLSCRPTNTVASVVWNGFKKYCNNKIKYTSL